MKGADSTPGTALAATHRAGRALGNLERPMSECCAMAQSLITRAQGRPQRLLLLLAQEPAGA
jgi:hypothetical protein